MSIDSGNTNKQQIENRYLNELVRSIQSLDPKEKLEESLKFFKDHEKLVFAIGILIESHFLKSLERGKSYKFTSNSKEEVYILTRQR